MVSEATVGGSKHYGSFFAETEYLSDAVSFSGAVLFMPTQKLNLSLNGSYIDGEGSMEMGTMPDVPQEVTDNIAAADYDFSSMDQYSDLAYTQLNLSVGAEYAISPKVSLTADAAYIDLTDDKGYVYGVETGSMFVVRSGVRVGF